MSLSPPLRHNLSRIRQRQHHVRRQIRGVDVRDFALRRLRQVRHFFVFRHEEGITVTLENGGVEFHGVGVVGDQFVKGRVVRLS